MGNYNLEKIINCDEQVTYRDYIKFLQNEISRIDSTSGAYRKRLSEEDLYQMKVCRNYASGFLFFIHNNAIPIPIGHSGLRLFAPIVKRFVERGDIPEEYLKHFS